MFDTCSKFFPDRSSAGDDQRWTVDEWAAWEAAKGHGKKRLRTEKASYEAEPGYVETAYTRVPTEPKHPPPMRGSVSTHGVPAPSTPQPASAYGAAAFPPPHPGYSPAPWAMPGGMAIPPPPQMADPSFAGHVQYADPNGLLFWGPPGLTALAAPSSVAPPPAAKVFDDGSKGKGGGGYGPAHRDDEYEKGQGKGKGEGKSSSSSSRGGGEPWGPYRTGWLNKCTDLVVLVLRERNSEAWQLAKAHANSSSMFPLLPTDVKNMF